jgi:L-ribulose-5-phosphate 4-epimerase
VLEQLKQEVYEANLLLPAYGLVILTWGNVSAVDTETQLVVIKPSGVDYSLMRPEQMVVVDLDGSVVEGDYKPSSDLPTHLELYRSLHGIGGVVHTHSRWATAFAQMERSIPCYGTTHADYFYGPIPCTRPLTLQEIQDAYEANTGRVIVETFKKNSIDPSSIPAVLVSKHGAFTWGGNARKAVENAIVLDEVAHMALLTEELSPEVRPADQALLDKHYNRKHGANAYYGQSRHVD